MHQSIKQWSAGDQPREKLILMGSKSLSEAELIAILMRAGTRNKSALDVAKELLTQNDNSIAALAKLSVHELMKIKKAKSPQVWMPMICSTRACVISLRKHSGLSCWTGGQK